MLQMDRHEYRRAHILCWFNGNWSFSAFELSPGRTPDGNPSGVSGGMTTPVARPPASGTVPGFRMPAATARTGRALTRANWRNSCGLHRSRPISSEKALTRDVSRPPVSAQETRRRTPTKPTSGRIIIQACLIRLRTGKPPTWRRPAAEFSLPLRRPEI